MSAAEIRIAPTTSEQRLEEMLAESVGAAVERAQTAFDRAAAPLERSVVLFGAGGFGRRTLEGLRQSGVEPLAFADNNPALWGSTIEGVPVFSPKGAAEKFASSAAFVVTIWNGRATERMADRVLELRALGCERVVPAAFLFWKYAETFLPHYPLDLPGRLLQNSSRVRAAFHLWTDEASRAEYVAQIAFRLFLDFDRMANPDTEHYFPRDLFDLRENETLIDCGAFDGDTIAGFIARQGARFDRILAYEPDPLNWERLHRNLAQVPADIRARISTFPQAVGASDGTIQFNSTGTDLSTAGSGATHVECVELDRSLQDVTPTLVKFDIEGFELDALEGAREVVARSRPILAVSAYHRQDHLWEVPLALASMCSRYRFFLRPHGTEGWDLVCYAIPEERAKSESRLLG